MTSTSMADEQFPPYTSITQLVSDSYSKKLEENVFKESPIMELLKQQTEKATRAMARDLEQQLFYGSSTTMKRNEGLRQIIADAYDEHMPKEAEEMEMSATYKIVEERKEARAREVFEKLDTLLDDTGLVVFEVTFDPTGKTYEYAARLCGNGRWYVTGQDNAKGMSHEGFKAWLVEKAVEFHKVTLEGSDL